MDTQPAIHLELPPHPTSVREARHLVGAALDGLPVDEVADVAVLLTSELVTNAVLYAHGPIEIDVRAGREAVRVAVVDRNPSAPLPRHAQADAISGRGLGMVDTLATRWGVQHRNDLTKEVWFELDLGSA